MMADPAVMGLVGHKNSGPSAARARQLQRRRAGATPLLDQSAVDQQGYRTFFRLCAHDAVQGQWRLNTP
ncbi:MAG: hypothetical protein U0401_30310 [Anaerolineae bacterium]